MQKIFKKISAKQFIMLCGGLLVCSILAYTCGTFRNIMGDDTIGLIDSTELQQEHMKYGFNLTDYEVVSDKVEKNQNLSCILNKFGISATKVHEVCQQAKDVFNVRDIKAGKSFSVLLSKDSLRTPEYFIYEDSSLEYVVFELQDEIKVYKGEKPVEKVDKVIKGKIESSLWNAMVDAKANPMLTMKMAEIFQWTIDFFGIKSGDSFRVLYEEWLVEGKPMGYFDIKAVVLTHDGKDNYAYKFDQAGKVDYYDEKGNSLQKAFLKAPLKFSRISSKFTNRRYHPVLKRFRAHHGVDYAAPTGTPVYSIGDGKVIKKAFQAGGGGNYITIKHNSTYKTCYMHLSRYAKGIRVGSKIKQGETIGYVGMTGIATGPHLDFRVYLNETPINPLSMKSPSKTPISAKNKATFLTLKAQLEEQLLKAQPDENLERAHPDAKTV